MSTNKKFTLGIITITLLVIIFGSILGYKDYQYNKPDPMLASQNVEECIITIQGSSYDVTDFRTEHTGGDVFKCGEDMTQVFKGAHKSYLPMIAKFKVN